MSAPSVNCSANYSLEKRGVPVLILCAVLLYLLGLGSTPIQDPDEPRVTGIVSQMSRTGDWVVPRLNGEPFLEKPPLFFWIAAQVMYLFGESVYSARIIPALAAIGCVLLVYFLARRMGLSALAAFTSGFILATSIGFWTIGRRCVIDMLLCFFTTSAFVCFYRLNRSASLRVWWYIAFVLSLAGAVMTKGLVGLAIPASALVIWLLLERNFSLTIWSLLLLSAVFCLIPTAVWLWFLDSDLGWNAVHEVVWVNNFGRFAGTYEAHVKPFFYYFLSFPENFMPWTLYLPIAVLFHWRDFRSPKEQASSRFLVAWFGMPFLLLSLSAGKRDLYLLPTYPAAALFVGAAVGKILEEGRLENKWFRIPSILLVAAVILASVGFCVTAVYFRGPYWIRALVLFPGLLFGSWGYRLLQRRYLSGFATVAAAALVLVYVVFSLGVDPLTNARNSYEPAFNYCRTLMSAETPVVLFKSTERLRGAAVYYLGRTIPEIDDENSLTAFLRSGKRPLLVSYDNRLEGIAHLEDIKTFPIGHKTIAVARIAERVR